MRVVIDTNVIVSAFYDPDSVPGRIIDAGNTGRILLCAPESVRAELRRVLGRVLELSPVDVALALQGLRIEWLSAGVYNAWMDEARALLRDPSDAPVLACALAIGCDIISGDRDLQVLKLKGIRVWRPSEFEDGAD